MPSATPTPPDAPRGVRSAYRPPVGLPMRRPGRWGVPASVLVHVILVILLTTPILGAPALDAVVPLGAGGPGPAGGGGGGRRGAGGAERLQFITAAPPAPPVAPPKLERPEVEPVRTVRPPKPVVPKTVAPAAEAPKVQVALAAPPPPPQVALEPGAGGGTGSDGTSGTGPGTGGGVGSGEGTGRGSGEGPGTGGGEGTIYPATPDFLVMPALPVPKRVQGKTIELRFTIDERGKILKVEFEPTGDASYDRQLRERLSEYRFRPAHKKDGTPVPSVYVTQLTL